MSANELWAPGGGSYFDLPGHDGVTGHWFAKLAEGSHVTLDRFPNIPLRFLKRAVCCDTSGQIRDVCRPIVFRSLENDGVTLAHFSFSNPTALTIDFNVPTGMSSPGFREL